MQKKIVEILRTGRIGVLPTDTLYGLVGSAFSRKAISRIYKTRKRDRRKPFIILISSLGDLNKFNVRLTSKEKAITNRLWPGKVSIVLRGKAFRLPRKKSLVSLLKKTGPLVAPSANLSGQKPAKNITQAKKYFGDKVDFYVSAGKLSGKPSTLIELKNGKIKILRSGSVKINFLK